MSTLSGLREQQGLAMRIRVAAELPLEVVCCSFAYRLTLSCFRVTCMPRKRLKNFGIRDASVRTPAVHCIRGKVLR